MPSMIAGTLDHPEAFRACPRTMLKELDRESGHRGSGAWQL
jgi:hypothetical protein